MDSRQPLDARAITLMVVLCAIWGMQQVVLKATAADIAPIMQIALRSGVAAMLVNFCWWPKACAIPAPHTWWCFYTPPQSLPR